MLDISFVVIAIQAHSILLVDVSRPQVGCTMHILGSFSFTEQLSRGRVLHSALVLGLDEARWWSLIEASEFGETEGSATRAIACVRAEHKAILYHRANTPLLYY